MGMIDLRVEASDKVMLDSDGAAKYLGISVSYLKKLRQLGGGPKYNRLFARKGIRYSLCELNTWLATRESGSTTEYPESLA